MESTVEVSFRFDGWLWRPCSQENSSYSWLFIHLVFPSRKATPWVRSLFADRTIFVRRVGVKLTVINSVFALTYVQILNSELIKIVGAAVIILPGVGCLFVQCSTVGYLNRGSAALLRIQQWKCFYNNWVNFLAMIGYFLSSIWVQTREWRNSIPKKEIFFLTKHFWRKVIP